jgi:hypothetical protein
MSDWRMEEQQVNMAIQELDYPERFDRAPIAGDLKICK